MLPPERITAVETGACPHTAIRDDISANLEAVEDLEDEVGPLDLVLVESGGDNLTATFSKGLVDAQIFVIDVAGGDDIPRKGGPGVTTADLLVVNKTDLAPYVGSDLGRMAADAKAQRGELPVVFQSLRHRGGCAATSPTGCAHSSPPGRHDRERAYGPPPASRPAPDGRGGTGCPCWRATGRSRCGAPGRTGAEARVMLVGAMSGPLGGDHLTVEAGWSAGPGCASGPPPPPSRCRGRPRARRATTSGSRSATGAELHWLPEQLISAAAATCTSPPASTSPPPPGSCCARSRCSGAPARSPAGSPAGWPCGSRGRTVLDQELACGPGAPGGWDGPAVLGGHRASGNSSSYGRSSRSSRWRPGCWARVPR